ncbi:uncharacterized protein K489DRAFT_326891, partial [Dissoconium aciculare CBS 342.82]|uniref:Heterokaryon incompatibility domain-containing protein n=1 Tax=Dissoconium aciculare CBS 342.82 TaxID=1314786 RepID=A0A6J3LW19_9PEZI
MSTRYQYRPLNPKRREIRVLSIDVNNPTAPAEPTPLECTVERISLTAWIRPSYYAVSYVWGDASRLATIKLDGQLVQIPYNSEQALRCLYRRTKDEKPVYSPTSDDGRVRIWLDAICIDQHNVAERNSQVAMMGLIYRAAVRTLIWLGEPDQSTHASVESVRLIVQQWCDWSAIEALYGRAWFTRLWVVQEALLAETAV